MYILLIVPLMMTVLISDWILFYVAASSISGYVVIMALFGGISKHMKSSRKS